MLLQKAMCSDTARLLAALPERAWGPGGPGPCCAHPPAAGQQLLSAEGKAPEANVIQVMEKKGRESSSMESRLVQLLLGSTSFSSLSINPSINEEALQVTEMCYMWIIHI